MTERFNFGAFLAPFYTQPGENPTLALRRTLDLARALDDFGYDEVWFGEHHSGGVELITSPELMCAWVAAQTSRIRVGTGVVSLPYHNPFMVAERAIALDHLTRGRFMLGLGPGILDSDALMLGLDPAQLRDYLREDLPVLLQLLRTTERTTVDTGRYRLKDAQVHLGPYSDFPIVITTIASPSGPTLAGRFGLGMLQLSGLTPETMQSLPNQWKILEQHASTAGVEPKPEAWRVAGLVHLAETRDQAINDVRYGLDRYFDYFQDTVQVPRYAAAGRKFDDRVEWLTSTGSALIGTPQDAIDKLGELVDASRGRVGCFLVWGHEWATRAATVHSYELLAQYVMPAFQGSRERIDASARWMQEGGPAYG